MAQESTGKAKKSTQQSNQAKPTRSDAARKVQQRRTEERAKSQAQAKVVGKVTKNGTIRVISTTKKRPAKSTAKKKKFYQQEIQLPLWTLLVVLVTLALLLGSVIILALMVNEKDLANEDISYTVTITEGMNAREVAALLEQSRIISSASTFERYLRQTGQDRLLQTGTFTLQRSTNLSDLANRLVQRPLAHSLSIRIYDGYTLAEIDQLLVTMQAAQSGEFLAAVDRVVAQHQLPFAEGWFLSGDYHLESSQAALQLATAMHQRLVRTLQDFSQELNSHPHSLNEILIVASLLQRETQNPQEMPHIAAIIYKRLEADWPLGIDASLRYALEAWNRPLTATDFELDSPYNSRKTVGLPPTGIGTSGVAALEAALKPATNPWWFYLHDKNKEIHYATSLEEHELNRKRYL